MIAPRVLDTLRTLAISRPGQARNQVLQNLGSARVEELMAIIRERASELPPGVLKAIMTDTPLRPEQINPISARARLHWRRGVRRPLPIPARSPQPDEVDRVVSGAAWERASKKFVTDTQGIAKLDRIAARFDGESTCSKCGETKAKTEFSADLRQKDGVASRCKDCAKSISAAYRAMQKGEGVSGGSKGDQTSARKPAGTALPGPPGGSTRKYRKT